MPDILVRPATVADAAAISEIHRSTVVQWRRWPHDGDPEFARFEDLSPYQRWLNGGPWMDPGTCAAHLSRLVERGLGLALVAELDGEPLAEAEAFVGEEPRPFGRNLNLSVLYARRGHEGRGLGSALMQAMEARARESGCATFVVTHVEAASFYARHGLAPQATWRRTRLPARQGHTRFQAAPLPDAEYEAVRGWAMPVGRYQSARQEWETRRPGAEPDFAEWRGLRTERLRLTVRRQPAALVLDESPREPGWADAHLWLPSQLHRQHLAAIQAVAARAGLQGLLCFVSESTLPLLGSAAADDGYRQEVWLKEL
jgi:predicted N-acetyltransferase YhbS